MEGQFCDDKDNHFVIAQIVLQRMQKLLKCICLKDFFKIDIGCQVSLGETDAVYEELCLPKRK